MSKAFTSEEASIDVIVPPRAPLPAGVLNYVTPRGLEQLRAERRELEAARARLEQNADEGRSAALQAWNTRLSELDARLATARLVEPAANPSGVVRFGSKVSVSDASGRTRAYEIVGVDEADPAQGKIAFLAPLAKALLGREVGDVASLRTPGKLQELEIVAVE